MTTVLSTGARSTDVGRAAPALSPEARRAATVAFAVYLVALAAAVFLPLPEVHSITGGRAHIGMNLDLSRPDLLRSWEAERNVLMTIPFGLLLPLVVRWRYEWLVAACLGVTLVIETTQLLGSLAAGWAWRAFDVDDIFLNTVGGFLGLAATGAALALRRRSLRLGMPGRRPPRLPLHRLVPGAVAAVVVAWAVISTLTTPTSTFDAGAGAFEIGVAATDRAGTATDDAGRPVQAVAVEGAGLAVWERPVP